MDTYLYFFKYSQIKESHPVILSLYIILLTIVVSDLTDRNHIILPRVAFSRINDYLFGLV